MEAAETSSLRMVRVFSTVLLITAAAAFAETAAGSAGSPDMPGADAVMGRRALLVGINKYSPEYGPGDLNSCVADAEGVRDIILLGDPSQRWRAADIRMLTDSRATKAAIREALSALAAESGAGDMVLYYHSGHGGQTDPAVDLSKTYVCAHDADYEDGELAADLALFDPETEIIVVVDACHSGGMFRDAGGPRNWPFARKVMAEYRKIRAAEFAAKGMKIPRELGANIAFMTSSDYDELSWESRYHGIYTGYLLDGCRRSFVDANGDGEYQFLELHLYAAQKAAAATQGTGFQQNAQSHNDELLRNAVARAVDKQAAASAANNDYTGDGKSDLALYHEETGLWYILSLDTGMVAFELHWGGPGFIPVAGDYTGDGKADPAVYHEASGRWYIRSLAGELVAWGASWGGPGLTPVAGDYSGDGTADLALYDKSAGYWYVATLKGQPIVVGRSLAGSGFTAVPGDYDGDSAADFALYHNGMGSWYVVSSRGYPVVRGMRWGGAGLEPVPGDYSGDGISDLAVYHSCTGGWYIWSHADNRVIAWDVPWGGPDFIPVPGDYNGDGVWDLSVYNRSTGQWFIRSVDGSEIIANGLPLGGPGYVPVRSAW